MKRKLLIWALLLALLLTGCGQTNAPGETEATAPSETVTEPPATSEPEESTDNIDFTRYENTVRVLCYNVYYQDVDRRSENIQDLMLKNDPDVLLLQEVSLDWLPHMAQFMENNGYSYYGYGRYGGEMSASDLKNGEQFTPILWKTDKYDLQDSGHFWLSSTPEEYSAAWLDGTISKYPRCVNWVILKDRQTGGEFLAMCIHTDPESDAVRTNSCVLTVDMLSKLRGDLPVIVGGDWNMGLSDSGYQAMTQSGYPDVRVKAADTDLGGSFNNWGKREEGNFAFGDHIFISENVAAEKFAVVSDYYDGEHISDHCPLLAVLHY